MTRRSCTLKWDVPKDDGGAEIIGYKIEYQEEGSKYWEKVRWALFHFANLVITSKKNYCSHIAVL